MVAINLDSPCIRYNHDVYNELVTRCITAARMSPPPFCIYTMIISTWMQTANRPIWSSGVMQTRDARMPPLLTFTFIFDFVLAATCGCLPLLQRSWCPQTCNNRLPADSVSSSISQSSAPLYASPMVRFVNRQDTERTPLLRPQATARSASCGPSKDAIASCDVFNTILMIRQDVIVSQASRGHVQARR
jgi:hypothetical protein